MLVSLHELGIGKDGFYCSARIFWLWLGHPYFLDHVLPPWKVPPFMPQEVGKCLFSHLSVRQVDGKKVDMIRYRFAVFQMDKPCLDGFFLVTVKCLSNGYQIEQ